MNTFLLFCNYYLKVNVFNAMLHELLNKTPQTNVEIITFQNIKTVLFPYQISNANWMINIEKNPIKINNILFAGGGLFDEVGMGKTLQTISLINYNVSTYFSKIKKNKLYSKATLIIVPNHLCGQWEREFQMHCITPLKIIKLLTKVHYKKFTMHELLIADVVIVSNRFFINCDINPDENNDDKTKTKTKTRTCRINDDKNANDINDKLLKSNDLLKLTKIFDKCINLYDIYWHRVVIDEYHEMEKDALFKQLKFIHSDSRWILSGTPLKETQIMTYTNKNLKNTSLSNILDYICFDNDVITKVDIIDFNTYNNILNHFSRNKQCNNMKDLKLPEIEEEIVWLNFSETERLIYNAQLIGRCEHDDRIVDDETKHNLFLRQVCCNPFIAEEIRNLSTESTVCDVDTMVAKIKGLYINNYNSAVEKYDDLMEKKQKHIEHKNELINEDKTHLMEYSNLIETINNLDIRIKEELAIIAVKKNTVQYYKNFIEILNNKDKIKQCTCLICMCEIDENDIGVTTCSHIFCYTCINMIILTSNNKCPTCNVKLNTRDIYMISKNVDKDVKKMGTKLAYIIDYIKKTPEKYRIIFSQWDYMLKKIGAILTENNINNVFCQGHVYQKDKALQAFNSTTDGKCKVLMMSSKSTVSGSNLSNAEEVIFIDIISGKKQDRLNAEQQAIGRMRRLGNKFKKIKILRLLIKQSIEEEIYKQNIDDKFIG